MDELDRRLAAQRARNEECRELLHELARRRRDVAAKAQRTSERVWQVLDRQRRRSG
jgi:hypothetical protein